MTHILGIETSCDETAAAVVCGGCHVLSSVVSSQHNLHEAYRGVVPEIASRAHLERILPVVRHALEEAGMPVGGIDAVAVGNRPGLIGSLIVGVSGAKALSWMLGKPLIGIDHVRAHLYAACLKTVRGEAAIEQTEIYPALGLVVSGGHTSLYEVNSPVSLRPLGRTIDDAAGEAFDKAAVILSLGYPGGPALDHLAQTGDAEAYSFPRSLLGRDSLDFSFSGLKTAFLYTVRGKPKGRGRDVYFERTGSHLGDDQKADLAASFQAAVVDILIMKLERALERLDASGRRPASLVIGGGVSANSLLRSRAGVFGESHGIQVFIPPMGFCVDNAAMIAGLAYHDFIAERYDDLGLPAVATTDIFDKAC